MFILDCTIGGTTVPPMLLNIIGYVIVGIKIGVPVLLIIFGMLDLGKAVMSSKEDEIKKAQNTFLKRLLVAAMVFFVITIVQFVVGLLDSASGTENSGFSDCLTAILSPGSAE